jgi:epoxide hydrolase 4
VVALDQRGYNLSDKPKGVENYDMKLLVGDVIAVIRHLGKEKAIIVGHDWGGAVSWTLAMHAPQYVDKLIILNLPHLRGFSRELASNPEQQKNSQYARNFQQPDAASKLTAGSTGRLGAGFRSHEEVHRGVQEIGLRGDVELLQAQLSPRAVRRGHFAGSEGESSGTDDPRLKDWALLPGALNNTWEWLEKDLTLVTVPEAGHFVQADAPDFVTRTMKMWLSR